MRSAVLYLFIIALSKHISAAARIFAWFPTASLSHQVVFRPVTQELAKRGHEVVVVTPDPAFPEGKAPKNLIEIDVHDISYSTWRDYFVAKQNEMTDNLEEQMWIIFNAAALVFEKQMNTPEMRKLIEERNTFDLFLIEGVAYGALAIRHKTNAPLVMINSMGPIPGHMEAFGAPNHPFLYPIPMNKKSFNLTMWEKIQELFTSWRISRVFDYSFEHGDILMRKYFGEDLPPVRDLMNNIDLLLLNDNPIWSGIRPVPPGVVFIGGIHQTPRKDLPEDLKRYLDSSKHGVIYMSFGTNVDPSLLSREKIQAFIKAFSELPYDVLWKWNDDELPGRTKNIKISKWLPQSDLLYHPNVKLFITQGGLQSTDEAIAAGVPVIGVPIFGDQWYNVERYVYHRVGLQLDISTLDADMVKDAIDTVIRDPSYRGNMVKMRDLLADQPMSPLDRAVWWIDHVLRHAGARHLRAPAANMSWAQYYELDLVLLVLGALLASMVLAIVIGSVTVKFIKRKISNVKLKKA